MQQLLLCPIFVLNDPHIFPSPFFFHAVATQVKVLVMTIKTNSSKLWATTQWYHVILRINKWILILKLLLSFSFHYFYQEVISEAHFADGYTKPLPISKLRLFVASL